MVVFMGFAVGGAIVLPVALSRGRNFLVTQQPVPLLVRSVVGLVQIATLFLALRTIPLLDGILLREAGPLWVPLLSLALFGERMPARLWPPISAGFVGMAAVLHPQLIALNVGYVYALANGLLFGLQSILTRRLDVAGEPVIRTLFYLYSIYVAATIVPAAMTLRPMPMLTWLYLAGNGLFLLASTTCLLFGFKHGPAYLLAPFGYSAVAFSAILDWIVIGRVPTISTYVGVALMVGAGIVLMYLRSQAKDQEVS